MPEKLTVSVKSGADMLGVGPRSVYRLIKAGRLSCVRFNRRVLIEPAALRGLVEAGRCVGGGEAAAV